MRTGRPSWVVAVTATSMLFLCGLGLAGCAGGGSAFEFTGSPFFSTVGSTVFAGPSTTGRQTGTGLSGATGFVDPCQEPESRKRVRISMRNLSPDYVHYFLAFIAFVNSDTYPTGAVCPDDIDTYIAFGYNLVPENVSVPFGTYCITGPALVYFHENGQFRTAGGSGGASLGSAIAPAQGSTPSYDRFFTSARRAVPVPDVILFHNPGTTSEGANLKVSRSDPNPCDTEGTVIGGDPVCQQDAWYYVDDRDLPAGSHTRVILPGSARRVPAHIQGTACECGAIVPASLQAAQVLATSGTSAATSRCNEFFRGGTIDFVFIRDDREPPIPQLLWRVTDWSGTRAHDYDPRAGVQ